VTLGSLLVATQALAPYLDQVEPKLDTINSTLGTPAQEHVVAASPTAARLSDGTTFYKTAVAGDNMGADVRVGGAAVSNANPVPVSDAGGSITVDASSLPLPTGAATESTLAAINSRFGSELNPAYVRLPQDGFGHSVVTEPRPVLQASFANGVAPDLWDTYTTLTGTATSTASSDGSATVSTGANGSSIASLTSIDRFAYRAGQPLRLGLSTKFSASAVGAFLVVGAGQDDGFAVGYNGTAFGFLRRSGGTPEIRTLTIATASSTAENVTVTLDGVATLVAVTASGNTVTTAREIAAGNYAAAGPGWDAYQFQSTVIFVARRAGARTGSYSVSGTTVVGSFAQTIAGLAPTDTWYAKSAWNGDRLDNSLGANNLSGATLDPTKINTWRVIIPFLGGGNVILQWYDPTTGQWSTCHTIRVSNTDTTATVRNPTFQLWIEAGGAANVSATSWSIGLFCDGPVTPLGPKVSIPPTFKTTVGNASETPIFTVRVERHYNGAAFLAPWRVLQLTVSGGATGQLMLRFYLNGQLSGPTNFGFVDIFQRPVTYDTGSTGVANGLPVGVVITSPSGGSTTIPLLDLGYALAPGDTVTVTAQQTSGSNGTVAIGMTGMLDTGNGGL
jgi:hypothetical protein